MQRTVLLLIVFLAGCKSADHMMQAHYRLETAQDLTQKAQYDEAITLLETMLADLEPQRNHYVRQRFYAYHLLTRCHLQQALEEYLPQSPSRFRSRRVEPGVLTAMLYLGATLDLLDAAEASEAVGKDGKRLIPGALEEISMQDVRAQGDLLVIALLGGLRFNDRMRLVVDRFAEHEDLTTLESCTAVMDRAGLPAGTRPWILLAVHRYQRRIAPREAYRYAISALHHEECRFDALTQTELIEWIESGSPFRFLCNECDEPVKAERPDCYSCGASYLSAFGVEREAGSQG